MDIDEGLPARQPVAQSGLRKQDNQKPGAGIEHNAECCLAMGPEIVTNAWKRYHPD